MVIYIDLVIIENIIIDLFLIYITGKTLKIDMSFKRILFASFLGGMYVVTAVYPSLYFLNNIFSKFVAAFILIFISFYRGNIISILKETALFILYSMLLAGICIFLTENYSIHGIDYNAVYNFKFKYLMISGMVIFIVISRTVDAIKNRNIVKNLIYNVDIEYNNIEKKVKAFYDTGNELVEPVTNLPVMIVENEVLKGISVDENNIYYIPYSVINGRAGKLRGFKPGCIKIHFGREVVVKHVIVASCNYKLSKLNDFDALLSRGII